MDIWYFPGEVENAWKVELRINLDRPYKITGKLLSFLWLCNIVAMNVHMPKLKIAFFWYNIFLTELILQGSVFGYSFELHLQR